eukprot:comp22026_c0_seq2/m.50715 comp22026_c0_seq2/g.50715  ORF comp22026_c0_seq2/g.50715 comp22026_c0_seq2/m.50715 type:complete len:426 (+) comp22026_c0_seq2:1019-2296(+)
MCLCYYFIKKRKHLNLIALFIICLIERIPISISILAVEVVLDALPACVVLLLEQAVALAREAPEIAGLEHECHCVLHAHGHVCLCSDGLFVCVAVWAVRGHAAVERCSAGDKAVGLGVVDAADQAHVLCHAVAVKVGWSECVLLDAPARREDDKVCDGRSGLVRRAGEHGEDARVEMVVEHGVHDAEAIEIILVWGIVAVPCDHIERGVRLLGLEERTEELVHNCPCAFLRRRAVFPCDRGLEVARVGESVGADRPELGQSKVALVHLEDVSAAWAGGWVDAPADAALHDCDFAWAHAQSSELCADVESAELRHEEHVAVCVAESGGAHRGVKHIQMCRTALLAVCGSGAADGDEALEECHADGERTAWLARQRERVPSELARVDLCVRKVRDNVHAEAGRWLERIVAHTWMGAIPGCFCYLCCC